MQGTLPFGPDDFAALYRSLEHALKRTNFARTKGRLVFADWAAFATSLGDAFFADVAKSEEAKMLIEDPPMRLLEGLVWEAPKHKPLENVVQLFIEGVCQVRHNYEHGEKLVSTPAQKARDLRLMSEAGCVLSRAVASHSKVRNFLPAASGDSHA